MRTKSQKKVRKEEKNAVSDQKKRKRERNKYHAA